jgi:hypothetical protein
VVRLPEAQSGRNYKKKKNLIFSTKDSHKMSLRGTEKFFADKYAQDERRACDSLEHAQAVLEEDESRTYAWYVVTRGRRGRRYACKYEPVRTDDDKKEDSSNRWKSGATNPSMAERPTFASWPSKLAWTAAPKRPELRELFSETGATKPANKPRKFVRPETTTPQKTPLPKRNTARSTTTRAPPNVAKNLPPLSALEKLPAAALASILNMLTFEDQMALLEASEAIQKHPAWKAVHMDSRNRPVTYEEVQKIGRVSNLRAVTLYGVVTDEWLMELAELTNLTSLNLALCDMTDEGIKHLATLTNLRSLNLLDCDGLTDTGVAHLAALANLMSLTLTGCYKVTDVGAQHLSALTNLTSLTLTDCKKLTDVGAKHLSALTNLTSLDLSGCEKLTTAKGTPHLSALTNLTSLNLTGCYSLSNKALQHLSLTNLMSLNIMGCSMVKDRGLQYLSSSLPNLRSLNLTNCYQITDAGVQHLSALTNLTSLYLAGCDQLTDAGMANLPKNLKELTIYLLTDEGIKVLAKNLKRLTSLRFQLKDALTEPVPTRFKTFRFVSLNDV